MVLPTRRYEVIPGFFAQTDPKDPNEGLLLPILPCFGLLDNSPQRWSRFLKFFEELAESTDDSSKTSYKLFILGRHGQGWHNVIENKYGTKRWDEYWGKLGRDGDIIYGPDPELTALGESQAAQAKKRWQEELGVGMPTPGLFLLSPLSRAIRTHQITFGGIFKQQGIIWETCREEYGEHLCDKRRTRSEIQQDFPEYIFEDGFAEEDGLYEPDHRETHIEAAARAKVVLDRIFGQEEASFVSITSHSGFINAFLKAVNHPLYALGTGGVIPVLVKSTLETVLLN